MTKINGVDMSIIGNLIEDYKQNPEKGINGFSSKLKWNNGLNVQAQVGNHKPMVIDEPNWLGGSDEGPNPVDYLLSSLGGCLSISFILAANGMGVKINSLEVEVTGQLDFNIVFGLKEGNSGLGEIDVQFIVDSDVDNEQIEELVSAAMNTSVIKNTLERNVQVNPTFKRNKKLVI